MHLQNQVPFVENNAHPQDATLYYALKKVGAAYSCQLRLSTVLVMSIESRHPSHLANGRPHRRQVAIQHYWWTPEH